LGTTALAESLGAEYALAPADAAFYARLSGGNVEEAAHAVENDYRAKWDWCAKVLSEVTPEENFDRARELVAMAKGPSGSAAEERAEMARLIGLWRGVVRDALAQATGADKGLRVGPAEGTIVGEWEPGALVRVAEALARSGRDVVANANRNLAAENLLTQVARIAGRGRRSAAPARSESESKTPRPTVAERRGR
jgi:hypothetical protein